MATPAFQGDDVPLLIAATIDCNDLDRMATFWSELLGVEIVGKEGGFAFLAHAPDRKVTVWLQEVPEPRTGKTRVHLDFAVPDLAATERRIVELGGTVGEQHTFHQFRWKVCADPEGNVFDVMEAPPAAAAADDA
jgi:predicted enzyme related to lactoylglutathione lyase